MTAELLTRRLTHKRRFATTIRTGLVVSGTIALAAGGPLVRQLVVTAVIAGIVGGGSYWVRRRLAAGLTGGTGDHRIVYPTHGSATGSESERSPGGRRVNTESTPVDTR